MKICKHFFCGRCSRDYNINNGHLSMGCPFVRKNGYPISWKQRLLCRDYERKNNKEEVNGQHLQ